MPTVFLNVHHSTQCQSVQQSGLRSPSAVKQQKSATISILPLCCPCRSFVHYFAYMGQFLRTCTINSPFKHRILEAAIMLKTQLKASISLALQLILQQINMLCNSSPSTAPCTLSALWRNPKLDKHATPVTYAKQ